MSLCDEIVFAVKTACVFCCAYWDKAKAVNYVFWFHNGEYSVHTVLAEHFNECKSNDNFTDVRLFYL